jgi:hypothetical protein
LKAGCIFRVGCSACTQVCNPHLTTLWHNQCNTQTSMESCQCSHGKMCAERLETFCQSLGHLSPSPHPFSLSIAISDSGLPPLLRPCSWWLLLVPHAFFVLQNSAFLCPWFGCFWFWGSLRSRVRSSIFLLPSL